jgi:hypothetical protein
MRAIAKKPSVQTICLPFLIILFGLLIKLPIFTLTWSDYTYDEIITTTISRQPISQLLTTVKAEPHPPGFYIFLKALPINNSAATKTIITSISYILILAALVYAHKNKLLKIHNLSPGLSLFFASFTFLEITSNIKQDCLSFPLLLLSFFIIIKGFNKKPLPKKEILLLNLLLLSLLTLGYLPFLYTVTSLTILTLYKKDKPLTISLIIQTAIFLTFICSFGYKQYQTNKTRFSWTQTYNNSAIEAVSTHLTGFPAQDSETDIITISFLTLIFLILFTPHTKGALKKILSLSLVSLILITFSYLTCLFIRIRYVSVLLLLLSILAGWGLSELERKTNQILTTLITLTFIIFAAKGIYIYQIANRAIFTKVLEASNSYSQNDKTGLLSAKEIFPLTFKLRYAKDNKNLVPINPFAPHVFENSTTITKNHLTISEPTSQVSVDSLINLISQNNLNQYLFYNFRPPRYSKFDNSILIMQALDNLCTQKEIFPITYDVTLFGYKKCRIESN